MKTHQELPNMYPYPGKIRAKSLPYLTTVIHQRMMSYLQIALHFPIARHPRTMQKSSPETDLLASPVGLLVVHVTGCEERPAGIDPIPKLPLSIYLPDLGVWPPNFYLRSTHSGQLPPLIQHLIPLFRDHTTCCLPPWKSTFWITSPLVNSSFCRLLCTTVPLIHMIICCTTTRQ